MRKAAKRFRVVEAPEDRLNLRAQALMPLTPPIVVDPEDTNSLATRNAESRVGLNAQALVKDAGPLVGTEAVRIPTVHPQARQQHSFRLISPSCAASNTALLRERTSNFGKPQIHGMVTGVTPVFAGRYGVAQFSDFRLPAIISNAGTSLYRQTGIDLQVALILGSRKSSPSEQKVSFLAPIVSTNASRPLRSSATQCGSGPTGTSARFFHGFFLFDTRKKDTLFVARLTLTRISPEWLSAILIERFGRFLFLSAPVYSGIARIGSDCY